MLGVPMLGRSDALPLPPRARYDIECGDGGWLLLLFGLPCIMMTKQTKLTVCGLFSFFLFFFFFPSLNPKLHERRKKKKTATEDRGRHTLKCRGSYRLFFVCVTLTEGKKKGYNTPLKAETNAAFLLSISFLFLPSQKCSKDK